jgi:repressor LexA
MATVTPKQLRTLRYIGKFIARRGYSPTLDEIAEGLGVSKPTVQQYLAALQKKGVVERHRYAHRSIKIVDPEYAPPRSAGLPLLGYIAAGSPIEALEAVEAIDMGEMLGLSAGREMFALRVKGNSMVEDGIFDGDYVVVERREAAEDGQLVVALLPDGSVTLKKFYREKGRVRLQPANPEMKPIYAREVEIQGIVRGVIRSFR